MEKSFMENMAKISHGLKMPINLIAKQADALKMMNDEDLIDKDYINEATKNILKNCNQLNYIAKQIINFSQVQSDSMCLICTAVDLKEVIKDFKNITCEYEEMYNVSIEYNVDISFSPIVILDMNKFEEIFLNLISNAIKYSKDENRKIEVLVTDSENTVTVSVKDYGIGISKENLEKIFEPFFRVQSFSKMRAKGTGIGLTIVKDLIKLCEGEISVESKKDKGSVFKFTLPKKPSKQYLSLNETSYKTQRNIFKIFLENI